MGPRSILVAVATVALLSACVPEGSETPVPTQQTLPSVSTTTVTPSETAVVSSSPSPSPTAIQSFPPPPADETEEQAAIREGWMNYWKVYDKFTADPFVTDFTETQIVTVSGSDQARAILDEIQGLREHGWRLVGHHVLRGYSILQEPFDQEGVRTVVVTYCYDGSQKNVVDATSGAAVSTTAADTYVEKAWLEKGLDGIWRVSLIGNEIKKC